MQVRAISFDELYRRALTGDDYAAYMINEHIYSVELTQGEIDMIIQGAIAEEKKSDEYCNANALVVAAIYFKACGKYWRCIELLERAVKLKNTMGSAYLGIMSISGKDKSVQAQTLAEDVNRNQDDLVKNNIFVKLLKILSPRSWQDADSRNQYRRDIADCGAPDHIIGFAKISLAKHDLKQARDWLHKLRRVKYQGYCLYNFAKKLPELIKDAGDNLSIRYEIAMCDENVIARLSELALTQPAQVLSCIMSDDMLSAEDKQSIVVAMLDSSKDQVLANKIKGVFNNVESQRYWLQSLAQSLTSKKYSEAISLFTLINSEHLNADENEKLLALQKQYADTMFRQLVSPIEADAFRLGSETDKNYLDLEFVIFSKHIEMLNEYLNQHASSIDLEVEQHIKKLLKATSACKQGIWDANFSHQADKEFDLLLDQLPAFCQPIIAHLRLFGVRKQQLDQHANLVVDYISGLDSTLKTKKFKQASFAIWSTDYVPSGVLQLQRDILDNNGLNRSNINNIYKCIAALASRISKLLDSKSEDADVIRFYASIQAKLIYLRDLPKGHAASTASVDDLLFDAGSSRPSAQRLS